MDRVESHVGRNKTDIHIYYQPNRAILLYISCGSVQYYVVALYAESSCIEAQCILYDREQGNYTVPVADEKMDRAARRMLANEIINSFDNLAGVMHYVLN